MSEAENLPSANESGNMPVPIEHPITPSEARAEQDESGDLVVVARYGYQMEACQKDLIAWCERKIAAMQAEAADLGENLETAKRSKWGTGGLHRAHKLALKRVEYYEKLKLALEAGHVLVPNFPVEMFAVRTKRKHPPHSQERHPSSLQGPQAEGLPAGEGRYVDDRPVGVKTFQVEDKDYHGKPTVENRYVATELSEEIDFPFMLAKPAILKATERALADKFFDELGVLPGRGRTGDPIVVGRILDPRSTTYNRRFVTFLIAWFVDTREL